MQTDREGKKSLRSKSSFRKQENHKMLRMVTNTWVQYYKERRLRIALTHKAELIGQKEAIATINGGIMVQIILVEIARMETIRNERIRGILCPETTKAGNETIDLV